VAIIHGTSGQGISATAGDCNCPKSTHLAGKERILTI